MNVGGERFSIIGRDTMIQKDDLVLYCGQVYKVAQVFKRSDLIVIKGIGNRPDLNYVWAWKCRKVSI